MQPQRDGIETGAVAHCERAKLQTVYRENASEYGNGLRCGSAEWGVTGLDPRWLIKPSSCSIVGPARRWVGMRSRFRAVWRQRCSSSIRT